MKFFLFILNALIPVLVIAAQPEPYRMLWEIVIVVNASAATMHAVDYLSDVE